MSHRWLLTISILCFVGMGDTADAYLKLGTRSGGVTRTLHWDEMPVRYFVSNRAGGGVSGAQLEQAVARAFATWDAIPTADVSTQFAGVTAAGPTLGDGISTFGFVERRDQDLVLGATSFLIDDSTGEIVEADIFLNSIFPWSVAAAGQTDRFDVESIALHEIGHLLGLGHSALGETELRSGGRRVLAAEAAMFPIAFSAGSIEGRTLRNDDIAGVSDTYPNSEFRSGRGSVSGLITKDGQGVIGAHVVAFNIRTGALVGGFSLSVDGRFVIGGLEEGTYALRVEPLDDGDLESFFDSSVNVDLDFQAKFHHRLVVVAGGRGTTNVDVQVVPK